MVWVRGGQKICFRRESDKEVTWNDICNYNSYSANRIIFPELILQQYLVVSSFLTLKHGFVYRWSYFGLVACHLKIFQADLQSVIDTLLLFLWQVLAQSKTLLTFAARKRGSGLFSEGWKKRKIKNKKYFLRMRKRFIPLQSQNERGSSTREKIRSDSWFTKLKNWSFNSDKL